MATSTKAAPAADLEPARKQQQYRVRCRLRRHSG